MSETGQPASVVAHYSMDKNNAKEVIKASEKGTSSFYEQLASHELSGKLVDLFNCCFAEGRRFKVEGLEYSAAVRELENNYLHLWHEYAHLNEELKNYRRLRDSK